MILNTFVLTVLAISFWCYFDCDDACLLLSKPAQGIVYFCKRIAAAFKKVFVKGS